MTNEIMSIFPSIQRYRVHSLCYSKMAFFCMKHETEVTQRKQNVALYSPHDLNNVHHLECETHKLTLMMYTLLPQ